MAAKKTSRKSKPKAAPSTRPVVLSDRQRRWCHEYLIDQNGTAACVRAGYSQASAMTQAAKLKKNPAVVVYLHELMLKQAERLQITADRVVQEYAKIAFLDPRAFYDAQGSLIPVHQLPEEVAAALSGMDVATERIGEDGDGKALFTQVRKIKFSDKRAALDSLARHLGMFTERHEHEHKGQVEHKHEISLCPQSEEILAKLIGQGAASE